VVGQAAKGWSVVGFSADWVEMDPYQYQHMEYWNIFNDYPLRDFLLEYYTKKKSVPTNILAVRQDGTFNR